MAATEADFHLLDIAMKIDTYGVVPYRCECGEGTNVQLTVTHSGVHAYPATQLSTLTKSFIWSQIRKLGFKRRRFIIKLYPTLSKV